LGALSKPDYLQSKPRWRGLRYTISMNCQTSQVTIAVNGDAQTVIAGSSLEHLLEQLGMQGQRVAIEHNQDVIPRSEYANVSLKAGDRVEIIRAIGGG